eukprot:TRINITY_DN2365_c0_g3_i1.p1 TRINITY_DN2365_c0_g3~~TRINITY_DN2365_c0_g3_i1.p1  ORF type:complete len:609 (+),score=120.26 TRINITY_DN2365_c0_g3_i1:34-1860(+)
MFRRLIFPKNNCKYTPFRTRAGIVRSISTTFVKANVPKIILKSIPVFITGSLIIYYWYNMPRVLAQSVDKSLSYFLVCAGRGDIKEMEAVIAPFSSNTAKVKEFVNMKHEFGWTALHSACCNNKLDVVKWLVEHGADVNARDEYEVKDDYGLRGNTAIRYRQTEFSNLINPKLDCKGWTPLHYAAGFGNVNIVKYLLDNGAVTNLKNQRGHTPERYIDMDTPEGRKISKLFSEAAQKQKDLERTERVKYPLEMKLQEVMVGQVMPIHIVGSAIRRRQTGWHDEDKPLVFLFLGSSGVGKTMLAKCTADYLVKEVENGFIRIDMSEYSHQHEVSKFIGAPPGYIGYAEGGQLTEKLKKCPNAVVLLDEVEKAHPDILTIMLQVFDEGRLTDGQGNTVDCRHAVFIMTSNLVQDEIHNTHYKIRPTISQPKTNTSTTTTTTTTNTNTTTMTDTTTSSQERGSVVFDDIFSVERDTQKFLQDVVQPILKRHFKRDEFLGRINEIVIFHPFNDMDLNEIVSKELKKWQSRALKRHNINIKWDDEIIPLLSKSFNPSYGFRSIKHAVERQAINLIAAAYEKEALKEGFTVRIGVSRQNSQDGIVIKDIQPPTL